MGMIKETFVNESCDIWTTCIYTTPDVLILPKKAILITDVYSIVLLYRMHGMKYNNGFYYKNNVSVAVCMIYLFVKE